MALLRRMDGKAAHTDMERARGGAGGGMEPGMRWSSEPREGEEEEEAVGSCYLIVQGYGEVPAGALHLVLGTLLL